MNELKAFDKYLKIALKIAVPIYIFNGEVKKYQVHNIAATVEYYHSAKHLLVYNKNSTLLWFYFVLFKFILGYFPVFVNCIFFCILSMLLG
jgi:hypothetical protein